MRYGSVCSGIEAATMAWHPLGWSPAFFSEIEKFPSAVLAHHYGSNMPGEALPQNGVPNLGDMTKFEEWPDHAIDLLVGGTPCQSFSVAGLRKGLTDPRGNLMLTYLAIAARYRPAWLVWENVPGALSVDEGNAFASLIGGMAELGYHAAWRVLDAQYIRVDGYARAVPQRRKRVFVVGYLGDWRRAAAVFLEPESLSGNPPPRREAGQGVAPTISARPTGGGGLGTDFDCDGGLIADVCGAIVNSGGNAYPGQTLQDATVGQLLAFGGNNTSGAIEVAAGLNAKSTQRGDFETETFIAFSAKDYGADASSDVSPTLRAGGHDGSHANAGVMPAVAIQERSISENPDAGPDGKGWRDDGAAYTIEARQTPQAVAFDMRGRENGSQFEGPHETANIRASSGGSSRSYVAEQWAVRRLTPNECHRLQGFSDNFCNIPWRGKDHAPDGPQYKALGNSMAVNVMRFIGQRIQMVEDMTAEQLEAAE